ncbi:MAG: metalloprotease [Rhodovulum sulfidophilum]|uniref:Metalloprotease n=1 Tax=Rhodovulum sulfidophilum TaxID=35806 RepID=A0A2W5NF55_RHOSU|nr:MAG: metalloprotease [Rhodovulum sulfidophilum]
MDWRGRRESSNIEDRRGSRMGGMGGMGGRPVRVGGLGLIVVLLLGAFFGVDLSGVVGPDDGSYQDASTSPSPSDPRSEEYRSFVAVVLGETEDVWGQLFQASNLRYEDPTLVLFSGVTRSACGTAQSAMGPFYCPVDHKVYLDTDFFDTMQRQLGARGEFPRAYVVAHEVGHHVQNLLGVLGQVNQARGRMSEADGNALSVRVELQADCYAGIWANAARDRLNITDDDIRLALQTAAAIGDDALQKAAQGYAVPDSFTHGTSEQRQQWFYRGFRSGDPDQCDTFNATSL